MDSPSISMYEKQQFQFGFLCRILGRTCINVENNVEYDWPVSILELFIKVQKLFSASFHLISLPGGGMTKMET